MDAENVKHYFSKKENFEVGWRGRGALRFWRRCAMMEKNDMEEPP
jgi:hypothetical protein